jgi:hypothetical protein
MRSIIASERSRRPWLWRSAALTLLGAIAGAGIAGNWCYWRGRALNDQLPYHLQAYSAENAPLYWFQLIIAAFWVLLWGGFARSKTVNGCPWVAVAVPAAVFGFFLWQQLGAAHACSF